MRRVPRARRAPVFDRASPRQVIKSESSRDQIRFDGLASHGTAKRKVKAIIGSVR